MMSGGSLEKRSDNNANQNGKKLEDKKNVVFQSQYLKSNFGSENRQAF